MPKLFTVLLGNFLQNITTLKTMIDLIYKTLSILYKTFDEFNVLLITTFKILDFLLIYLLHWN